MANPPSEPLLDDVRRCTELLQQLAGDSLEFMRLPETERLALLKAAGRISRPGKLEKRQHDKLLRRARKQNKLVLDREARATTGIRAAREATVFVAPKQLTADENGATWAARPARVLQKPRHCYVCKAEYTQLHHFYDSMCDACGEHNYRKRFQTASLNGRVAVITGSRLKIGYQATLMMLRAGAQVIATTRFPHDSAARFTREPDFADWGHRLQIYGLDLRHSPSVELFCRYIAHRYERLDILINNAAQTVRRPQGFYAHLLEHESLSHPELPAAQRALLDGFESYKEKTGVKLLSAVAVSQLPYSDELFPIGKLDADLQQVDLRKMNSWRMRLGDVPAPEMLEVQLVNSVAPFILCSQLKPLMMNDRTDAKHIVNVSAMEGIFSRGTKTDKHPHTNMAKAALNMMTYTSAPDYARDGIFMNAVDTGWVTDEDPATIVARKQAEQDFQPPLDIVDGAARVCDPFFSGLLTGQHVWGKFLKDYAPSSW